MLKAVNPATGQTVREVKTDTAAEVEQKIAKSLTAFQGWKETSFETRAAQLYAPDESGSSSSSAHSAA